MATRRPEAISRIDEIVAYYTSDKPGRRKWFSRKMNLLPEDQQQEVWTELRERAVLRPEDRKPELEEIIVVRRRNLVAWTEEEWDQLAKTVWLARKNDPSETLIGLVKKVMFQFPERRRRTIRVLNEIKPLVERLQAIDEKSKSVADDLEFSKLRIAEMELNQQKTPTREEVLATLPDEEILQRYRQQVLHLCSPDEIIKQYSIDALLEFDKADTRFAFQGIRPVVF